MKREMVCIRNGSIVCLELLAEFILCCEMEQ